MKIILTSMDPAKRDALDTAAQRWQTFRATLPQPPQDEAYAALYWLFRYSGLVQATDQSCPNCATLRELVEQWQRFHDHVMACGECLTIFVSGGVLCSKGCELWNAAAPAVPATPTPPTDAAQQVYIGTDTAGNIRVARDDGGTAAETSTISSTGVATCQCDWETIALVVIRDGEICYEPAPPCPTCQPQRKEGES